MQPDARSAASPSLRTTCWICGKKLRKPDKAPRALCAVCATNGGLGPYT
jgi:hypothetical protein